MKKILLSLLWLAAFTFPVAGQQRVTTPFHQAPNVQTIPQRTCGTGELDHQYEQWLQPLIQQMEQQNAANKGAAVVYTIPVVFHIIHNNSNVGISYNISTAQVLSQLDVLNEDFRRLNLDAANTPAAFLPAAADCEVNFCLAQTDPSGNPTTGIDRINRITAGFSAPPYLNTYIDATIKPATIWNTNNYLNIWVVPDYTDNFGNPLLGHATFPSGSGLTGLTGNFGTATTDGVVLWYRACGRVGSLDPNYNKGRTASHEIGHWLGLRHIWGDSNCGNDFCADTPTQQTANFGCPFFPSVTCGNGPNGDQFMNYMDYCDDDCLNMFTTNQKTRIQTVLLNSPMRVAQRNSTACNAPSAAPVAQFTANNTTIPVGGSVNFTDQSTNSPTGWAWTFTGGTPSSSSQQNPQNIVYNAAGTYTVSLVATNGSGSDTETKTAYITVGSTTSACDTITNFDFATDTATILLSGGTGGVGYASGQNNYGDIAKADIYSISGTNQTVDGVFIVFGVGTSSGTGQTANVRVWDNNGTSGLPNTILGTTAISYDTIASYASTGDALWVDFVPNIPVSGDIYVGVEFGYNAGDTLAIVHCADGNIAVGTAYERWSDNTWHPYSLAQPNGWGINVAHLMLPVICPLVGIGENTAAFELNIYPNPAGSTLNVMLPNLQNKSDVRFTLLNMLGGMVSSVTKPFASNGIYQLDVNELSQGFYFLEVLTKEGRRLEKIQIAR
jgi:PKD repeat protein